MYKHFRNLFFGVSVLPALAVMPAMATIMDNTVVLSENSELSLQNVDWVISGATGTAGSRASMTGVNVDTPVSFTGNVTNINTLFPNSPKRVTGVFVGHATTPLQDAVHFSATNTSIDFHSAAGNDLWPLALEVQNATAIFDGDGDVLINDRADAYTAQSVTSRANSNIIFENDGNLTINAKSPYGANGIVNEGELSVNIGGDLTINTGAIDEQGNFDSSARLRSNSVAIMAYNDVDIKAKNVNLNGYGAGSDYTPLSSASDGTIIVELEGGNVSVDAESLNIVANSTAQASDTNKAVRGIMFVKSSDPTTFSTSQNTVSDIRVSNQNGEAYGIDFDLQNASTGHLVFGNDLSITAIGDTAAWGALINSGSDLTVNGDLTIRSTATGKSYGLNVAGGDVTVNGDLKIGTVGETEDAYGIYVTSGNVTGTGDVNILASNRGIRAEDDSSNVELTGKNINIVGDFNALRANNGASITLGNEETESIVLNSDGQLGAVSRAKSQISLNAKDIKISNTNGYYGVLAQNSTSSETDVSKMARFDINGENIQITADDTAVAAFSQGIMNINGNTTISGGESAISARGGAQVYINKDTDNTLKMDGNIDFDYDKYTSGTAVDAIVDITLAGADSYWTGNTIASYGSGKAPDDSYMKVNSVSVTLKDGATWNATKIVDNMNDDTSGSGYVAMNNLYIDGGIVNIKDTGRGLIVETSDITDATFNSGKINIGTMTLSGGTNVFNNDIVGINTSSALNIKENATLNIGTNNIDVNTITLNGNMLATLRSGDEAQITANAFNGTGNLTLTMKEAGTYKVFGNASFANLAWDENAITANSPIYNLSWDAGDVTATRKTVEEIADTNNVSNEAAQTVSNLMDSSSDKLNDLAVLMQEKLATGTDEDKAAVEQATAAIHPEKESIVQSVATSVQNTVTDLASARMALHMVGRGAGDVQMTSGGIWAQGVFNKSKQNNAFDGYTRGVAFGSDATFNRTWTLGAGYSYAHSDIDGTARDTEIDSSTLFIYGQYKPTAWYMNSILNYTASKYSESAYALGVPVFSDYDVDSFGATIATGYNFASGVTPELGLRYIHIMADDYTNSLGVKHHFDNTDFMTATLGGKYAFSVNAGKYTTFLPQLNAAVKYDLLSDNHIATVTMPGIDTYSLEGKRLSRFGGEFGIGLAMKYRNLDLSVNYDIDVRDDYTSQTGMLKFRCNF